MMQGLASKITDEVLPVVAKMCLLEKQVDRPEMQDVVEMLRCTGTVNVDIPESDAYEIDQSEKLGLVEQAMEKHPAVSQAKAFCRTPLDAVFCAIVPKKGSSFTEVWLRKFAMETLPVHMVPKEFFYWRKYRKT